MFLRALSSSYLADIFWFPLGRLCAAASRSALSPCGRGPREPCGKLVWVRGWFRSETPRAERYPSSGASRHLLPQGEKEESNYTTVKNGSGAPSVGLNTTFTF